MRLTKNEIGIPDRPPSMPHFARKKLPGADENLMGGRDPAMNKQHLVYRSAGRAWIAASLLGVAYATASAQGTVGPPPVISPNVATLVGTVSVTQLSASQANQQALQNVQPFEMPKHRLPDGSLTSAPRSEMLKVLPRTPEPNAGVESLISNLLK